jgi:hypothetical protein
MRRAGCVVVALVAASGCTRPATEVWQLTDFRVLGVKVEPAEPARGERFTLTLASADPRRREVQVVWIVCATALGSAGMGADAGASASGGCTVVTDPSSPLPFPDLRSRVTARVPEGGGAPDPQGREALTVLGFACAGGTLGAPADGGTQPTCNGADARGWQFTRTVYVRPPEGSALNPPNANPAIAEVRFGGEGAVAAITQESPPSVPRCTDHSRNSSCPRYRFEVGFTPASRESYREVDPVSRAVTTRTERLTTGYVVEGGTLAGGFRTDSIADPMSRMDDEWVAPERAGTYRVFVYVSDGRGGFDWTERAVRVE